MSPVLRKHRNQSPAGKVRCVMAHDSGRVMGYHSCAWVRRVLRDHERGLGSLRPSSPSFPIPSLSIPSLSIPSHLLHLHLHLPSPFLSLWWYLPLSRLLLHLPILPLNTTATIAATAVVLGTGGVSRRPPLLPLHSVYYSPCSNSGGSGNKRGTQTAPPLPFPSRAEPRIQKAQEQGRAT